MENEFQSSNLLRERDFYRAKIEELTARVKTLEFDNAELTRRDGELTKRLSELNGFRGYNKAKRR